MRLYAIDIAYQDFGPWLAPLAVMSHPKPLQGVPAPIPRPQSQIDEERGDWEGMGQSQIPEREDPTPKPNGAKPTPRANSLAGEKG